MYDFDFGSGLNEPVTEKTYNISDKLPSCLGISRHFDFLAFNEFT